MVTNPAPAEHFGRPVFISEVFNDQFEMQIQTPSPELKVMKASSKEATAPAFLM